MSYDHDITVLLVDDHVLVRGALRLLLEETGRMKVVGEASDGEEAVRQADRLQPDIVVMDIEMPRMNGIEATKRITSSKHGGSVLILSQFDHAEYLEPIMSAGAMGYIKKSDDKDRLIATIDIIASGRMVLPRAALASYNRRKSDAASGPRAMVALLGKSHRGVLELTARGLTARQIADTLFLAPKTVENYRAQLKSRLGFKDRAGLVDFALRAGLLER